MTLDFENLEFDHYKTWYIKELLYHQLLVPDQEFLQFFINKRSNKYAYFLMLLCQEVPTLKVALFQNRYLPLAFYLWHKLASVGPVTIGFREISSMLCLVHDPLAFYNGCVAQCWIHQSARFPRQKWFDFLEHCFKEHPAWAEAFLSIPLEKHKEYLRDPIFPYYDLSKDPQKLSSFHRGPDFLLLRTLWLESEDWWNTLRSMKQTLKILHKTRMDLVKEDLMAATWHPNRFMRWCLDEEDKADHRNCWPGFDPNVIQPPV